ncbi:MAG: A/G-specific adenine glycosylase [Candidatus Helarchaeota archaeon]
MYEEIASTTIKFFQQKLIEWYKRNGRDLPWRRTRDPYHILVSEFMLQQTQVVRVEKEFYSQFLEKFPSFEKLTAATEEEVLEAWKGLGYYNRARNLHKIAKIITTQYQGKLPSDFEIIQGLPGVGRYTAGAILSFAFELDFPIVDTNVERIVRRVFLFGYKIASKGNLEKKIWKISEKILHREDPFTFNQAILDFGALICKAQKPYCSKCPMRSICLYFQAKISKKDSIYYWIKREEKVAEK